MFRLVGIVVCLSAALFQGVNKQQCAVVDHIVFYRHIVDVIQVFRQSEAYSNLAEKEGYAVRRGRWMHHSNQAQCHHCEQDGQHEPYGANDYRDGGGQEEHDQRDHGAEVASQVPES